MELPVPVMVIVYVPCTVDLAVVTERVELPEPPETTETVGGLNDVAGSLLTAGDTVALRLTDPAKPFKLVIVTVNIAIEPLLRDCELGLAATEKSGGGGELTTKLTDAECDVEPNVPVTDTV